jgi:phage-related baseplate assembly protein
VPKGTRITDESGVLVWETVEDAYVPVGETSVQVQAQCQTAGAEGNGYAAGQISAIVDVFDYYSACKNVTATEGGSDGATDDEFYELMRESMDAYSTAGAKGGYEYWAKQVSTQIADVVANSPSAGYVDIYILMEGGEPAGEEMKAQVLAACSADEVRPLTDNVSVEDPEAVEYDIEFTYYLQTGKNQSGAEVAAAVEAAVKKYKTWQSAKLGRDINPDELREYLYHTGVKRIELTAPTFTALRDGTDNDVPQLAKVGTVTIRNGGSEHE